MLTIKKFPVNPIEENTYVVSDESGHAFIIDCGALYAHEREAIGSYISSAGLTLEAHLLTHAHFDHAFGSAYVHSAFGLGPRFHAADASLYTGMDQQLQLMFGMSLHEPLPPAGEPLSADTPLQLGQHRFRVIETPGHTPGGICLYAEHDGILFSGDSLFRQSIGRTDLPGGNYRTLIESLTALFAWLPDQVTIYPGHGPATTAAFERQHNPYL